MTRSFFARAATLFLSLSLPVIAGCCPNYRAERPSPPPVQEDKRQFDAVETQLRTAEAGAVWDKAQDRAFAMHMAGLSRQTALDYAHRLARDISFGKIKVAPHAPPPENAPACPCGGNACGAAVSVATPVTTVPGRTDRPLK